MWGCSSASSILDSRTINSGIVRWAANAARRMIQHGSLQNEHEIWLKNLTEGRFWVRERKERILLKRLTQTVTVWKARRCFRTGLKALRWDRCTNMDCSGRFCLSAAQFAVTQSNSPLPLISEVSVTNEASSAVNSHVNRHCCQYEAYNSHINCSGRTRHLTFLFWRQTPLRATSVPTWYNSFLSHKLKTLGKKDKRRCTCFPTEWKPRPLQLQHSTRPEFLV